MGQLKQAAGDKTQCAFRKQYRLAPWAMTSNVSPRWRDGNIGVMVRSNLRGQRLLESRIGQSVVSLQTIGLWCVRAGILVVLCHCGWIVECVIG